MTLEEILSGIGTGVATAADWALDAPGDYVRGAVGGKFGERMTGKELMGWDDPNSWMDDIANFGVETVTDPLNLIGGLGLGVGGVAIGSKLAKLGAPAAVKFGSRASDMADVMKNVDMFENARKYGGEILDAGESVLKGSDGAQWAGRWTGERVGGMGSHTPETLADLLSQTGQANAGMAPRGTGFLGFTRQGAAPEDFSHEFAHAMSRTAPTSTSPVLERMASRAMYEGNWGDGFSKTLAPILDEMNAYSQEAGDGMAGLMNAGNFLFNPASVKGYAKQMENLGTSWSPTLHALPSRLAMGIPAYQGGMLLNDAFDQ